MNDSSRKGPGLRALVLVVGTLFMAAGLLSLVLMGWVMPREYESTAVIQVMGDGEVAGRGSELMEAEARRVVGAPTLERVAERLHLEKRWSADTDEVRELLSRAVRAEVRAGTDLIEITVRHTEPGDARDVAIALAEEYRDLRMDEETEKAEMALEALDEELKAQEERVEEKRKEMNRLLKESGVTIEGVKMEMEELGAIGQADEKTLLELHAEGDRLDEIVRELGRRRGADLFRYAASVEAPQNTAAVLWSGYEELLMDSRNLQEEGFGEAHPQVVAKEIQLSLLKDDLERAVKRMRKALEEQRRYVEVRRDALARGNDREQSGFRSLRMNTSAYLRAKRGYWDELALLQGLEMRRGALEKRVGLPIVLIAGSVDPESQDEG